MESFSLLLFVVLVVALLYFNRLIKKSVGVVEGVADVTLDLLEEASVVAKDALNTHAAKVTVSNSSARAEVAKNIATLAEEGKLCKQSDLDKLIADHL